MNLMGKGNNNKSHSSIDYNYQYYTTTTGTGTGTGQTQPPEELDLMDASSSFHGHNNSEGVVMEEREHMFDKVVTPSDVGKLNRLVIPKQYAEKYFPLDNSSTNVDTSKGLLLNFEDVSCSGKLWRFRYSYWNSSQSYVMTKGWSRFVKDKKLDPGDIVSFHRAKAKLDRLFIDCRRRPPPPPPPSLHHHPHHHLVDMLTSGSSFSSLRPHHPHLIWSGQFQNRSLQSPLVGWSSSSGGGVPYSPSTTGILLPVGATPFGGGGGGGDYNNYNNYNYYQEATTRVNHGLNYHRGGGGGGGGGGTTNYYGVAGFNNRNPSTGNSLVYYRSAGAAGAVHHHHQQQEQQHEEEEEEVLLQEESTRMVVVPVVQGKAAAAKRLRLFGVNIEEDEERHHHRHIHNHDHNHNHNHDMMTILPSTSIAHHHHHDNNITSHDATATLLLMPPPAAPPAALQLRLYNDRRHHINGDSDHQKGKAIQE